MSPQVRVKRLLSFIRQHGCTCCFNERDGLIYAESVAVYPGGEAFTTTETIEPTVDAVREWLGY